MSDVETRLHYHAADEKLTIERVQDVEPIIEANKRQFDVDDKRFRRTFNHVARIPNIVLEKWAKDNGMKYDELMRDHAKFRRFLNDPDNKLFRTKPGRI